MMRRHQGFTLIELSIVLVIIGLLVGGVLAGRDLIHAAEMRSQIGQFEQYQAAVRTFQAKYNCEPGRCVHGVALGVGADADPADDIYMQPVRACDDSRNGGADCPSGASEAIFFVNLRTAGFIKDMPIDGSYHQRARLSGSNLSLRLRNTLPFVDLVLSNFQVVESYSDAALTALEAQNMDAKMDDGMPDSGKMVATGPFNDWASPVGHDTDNNDLPYYDAGPAGDPVCITTDFTPYRYNTVYGTTKTCVVGFTILN